MLNRLTIGTKIAAAFGLITVMVLVLGLTCLNRMSAVNDRAIDVRDNWLPSVGTMGLLLHAVDRTRLNEARFVIQQKDDARRKENVADFNQHAALVQSLRAAYEPSINRGTDDERLMTHFDAFWAQHVEDAKAFFSGQKGDPEGLFEGAYRKTYESIVADVEKDLDFNQVSGKSSAGGAGAIYDTTQKIILAALGLTIALCLAAIYIVIGNVSSPIKRITFTMNRLSERDLTAEVEFRDRKDEIGAMAASLQVFKDSMISADAMGVEKERENAAKVKRAGSLDRLMQNFEVDAGGLVSQISSASTELEATSQAMANNASQTDQQASSAGQAASEASAGV
jgi:methyl-accepting chemotaxis protein